MTKQSPLTGNDAGNQQNRPAGGVSRNPAGFKDRSLISWVGGKRLLRKVIAPLIPTDIQTYVEPFGGGGWILFYKDKWAGNEVYNDMDGRLVNLFRVVKYHPEELKRELHFMLHSRELFRELCRHEGSTDIQRAARFMFLIKLSFGGDVKDPSFAVTGRGGRGAPSVRNMIAKIEKIADRLDKVSIEHLDFERCLDMYDAPATFFYCDPPYTKGKGYATAKEGQFDHERLRECLGRMKGRFLLSYDDSNLVRDLYRGFHMKEVVRVKGINNRNPKGKEYRELLIANYSIG